MIDGWMYRKTVEMAKDILSKISDFGANGQIENDAQSLSGGNRQKSNESDNKKETTFVFNVIDDLNQKTRTALSVKETNFLINKVEQLAKDAVEKDAAN